MLFQLDFVPADFDVPETADAELFRLHPLRLKDSLDDYNALMIDLPAHLRTFQPSVDPSVSLSYDLYTNLRELGWHENEFYRRTAFTYVIRGKNPEHPDYRGCLYLFPTTKQGFDVEVYLWISPTSHEPGFEQTILAWVRSWLTDRWPFQSPLWPNREITWEEYFRMPDGRKYVGVVPTP